MPYSPWRRRCKVPSEGEGEEHSCICTSTAPMHMHVYSTHAYALNTPLTSPHLWCDRSPLRCKNLSCWPLVFARPYPAPATAVVFVVSAPYLPSVAKMDTVALEICFSSPVKMQIKK